MAVGAAPAASLFHLSIYASIYRYTSVYIHIYIYIHIYAFIYTQNCVFLCEYQDIEKVTSICIYTRMFTYIYIYICIYYVYLSMFFLVNLPLHVFTSRQKNRIYIRFILLLVPICDYTYYIRLYAYVRGPRFKAAPGICERFKWRRKLTTGLWLA